MDLVLDGTGRTLENQQELTTPARTESVHIATSVLCPVAMIHVSVGS